MQVIDWFLVRLLKFAKEAENRIQRRKIKHRAFADLYRYQSHGHFLFGKQGVIEYIEKYIYDGLSEEISKDMMKNVEKMSEEELYGWIRHGQFGHIPDFVLLWHWMND